MVDLHRAGTPLTTQLLLDDRYACRMHNYLSSRCSIDFCEAHAISEGLKQMAMDLRANPPTQKSGEPLIEEVLIISDSETVIEWIRGRYRIRNPRMQGLIDDILHFMDVISSEHSLKIFTRWTKSHIGTIGNEVADTLASLGLHKILELKDRNEAPLDLWRWYNLRASVNYNKRFFRENQEEHLQFKIKNSRFGRVMQEEFKRNWDRYPKEVPDDERVGYRWSRRWRMECADLSRSDIRVLLMLRTGHDGLAHYKYHAHNKGDTPMCRCGTGEQHLHHLLRECTLPSVRYLRHNIQQMAQSIFKQNIAKRAADALQVGDTLDYYARNMLPILEVPPMQYFCDPECYIYPDGRLPRRDRAQLLRAVCHFYKLLRRKKLLIH